MNWVYWAKLYDSRFQANCLKVRIEQDWWIGGDYAPQEVEIFRVRNGKYGVRYSWDSYRRDR